MERLITTEQCCDKITMVMQGGDDWVLNPPDQSLAYILADHGFDVWIGNMRCTRWSHGHISLSSSNWVCTQ